MNCDAEVPMETVDFFGVAVPVEDLGNGRLRVRVADIPEPPAPPELLDPGER